TMPIVSRLLGADLPKSREGKKFGATPKARMPVSPCRRAARRVRVRGPGPVEGECETDMGMPVHRMRERALSETKGRRGAPPLNWGRRRPRGGRGVDAFPPGILEPPRTL